MQYLRGFKRARSGDWARWLWSRGFHIPVGSGIRLQSGWRCHSRSVSPIPAQGHAVEHLNPHLFCLGVSADANGQTPGVAPSADSKVHRINAPLLNDAGRRVSSVDKCQHS